VAVLHGRVGLGPELRGLPQLECGLLGQAHGPAPTDEGELLGVGDTGQRGVLVLGEDGLGIQTARPRSSPRVARSRKSVVVANRVCTTERSSTSAMSRQSVPSSVRGVPAVATMVVVRTPCSRRAVTSSMTSVVVPEREIATTWSKVRPAGNSLAACASVTPWPACSRSTAYAWAM
jgi:hypothetical protein